MDSLRSPLTPDVRHGCAAQSLALTASRFRRTSSRVDGHRRTASTPAPHDVARSHPARTSSPVIRPRGGRVFPEHNGAHPVPLMARPPWLAVPPRLPFTLGFGSPAPRAFRSSWSSRSAGRRLRLPVPHRLERRRETRDALLHRTGGLRVRAARSARLQSRPGASPAYVGGHGHPQSAPFPFGRA